MASRTASPPGVAVSGIEVDHEAGFAVAFGERFVTLLAFAFKG